MQVFNTSAGELITRSGFVFQPGLNTLSREDYEKVTDDPGVERWSKAALLVDPASVATPAPTPLDDDERAELERLRELAKSGTLTAPAGDPPAGDPVGNPDAGKTQTAAEAIAAINAAADLAALAPFEADDRKTVKDALAARKAALAQ
jgi:hypothetical protein